MESSVRIQLSVGEIFLGENVGNYLRAYTVILSVLILFRLVSFKFCVSSFLLVVAEIKE